MKNRKNKYITYCILTLSAFSLVGVGFAAWEINGSIDDKTSVSVSVGDLTNKTLIVEIKDTSDLNIAFDNVKGGSSTISNDNGKYEDLIFSIDFRLESSRTINDNKFKITATFDKTSISVYQELHEEGYIDASCLSDLSFNLPTSCGALTTNNANISGKITYDSDDFKGADVSLIYTFHWGGTFKGKNPGLWEGDILEIGGYLEDFTAKAQDLDPISLTITPSYEEQQHNE